MRVRLWVDWGDGPYPYTPAGETVEVDDPTGRMLLGSERGERVGGLELETATRPAYAVAARTAPKAKKKTRRK